MATQLKCHAYKYCALSLHPLRSQEISYLMWYRNMNMCVTIALWAIFSPHFFFFERKKQETDIIALLPNSHPWWMMLDFTESGELFPVKPTFGLREVQLFFFYFAKSEMILDHVAVKSSWEFYTQGCRSKPPGPICFMNDETVRQVLLSILSPLYTSHKITRTEIKFNF